MSGFKVADAYVELHVDDSGMDSGIKGAVSKSSSAMGSVGKAIGGVAIAAGVAVAAVGVGLAGLAAKGGFERALSIQDAQAKLTGLGYSAGQITGIMDNALASVKGTAFGLGDAATVAAGLLAAGVKSGDELTRSLKLTADAATIAGISMNDMGAINNKIAASNKLTGETLQQLSDRGLPVLQWIAKEYGVTADAAKQMVSDGKVDFATYQKLIEDNIGGAAMASGQTFRGSLANMGAALSRFGAMFASPIVAAAPGLFQAIAGAIDKVSAVLKPVAEAFGNWITPKIEAFAEAINKLDFTNLMKAGSFTEIISAAVSGIGDWLANGGATTIITGFISMREKLFNTALAVFGSIVEVLPEIITQVVNGLSAMITGTITMLTNSFPLILQAALQAFIAIVQALLEVVPQLITSIVDMIPLVVQTIVDMIPMILDAAVLLFTSLIDAVIIILPTLLQQIIDMLPKLIESVLSLIPKILESAIKLFTALVDAIPVILPLLLNAIIELLPKIITSIVKMLPAILEAAIGLFTALVTAVPRILPQLLPAIIGLIPKIVGALIGMIPVLIQAGFDLIVGLVKGLWNAAPKVGEALINIAKGAIKGFLALLGIKSPSRLFAGFGDNIGVGLANGIDKSSKLVDSAMAALANTASGTFQSEIGMNASGVVGSGVLPSTAPVATGGDVFNVTLDVSKVQEVSQVIELMKALKQTARQGRTLVAGA